MAIKARFSKTEMNHKIYIVLKGQVQGLGWFLTRFPLRFAANNDVGEIVIWGL